MNHGLSEKTVERISEVLARFPEVERAVLYGSRAKGNFRPGSDIDLTLQGRDLDQRLLARIDDALDDLLLPYCFSLSLFAKITDPAVTAHIERVGVVFYEQAATGPARAE